MYKNIQPTCFYCQESGKIPNSKFPVLLYQNIFSESGDDAAQWLELRFGFNDWTNSWRWGIYDFHHYHSNTHEVLGVFKGTASVLIGGDDGELLQLAVGSIVVIPAGVAHKCVSHSDDFSVVGAYPNGVEPDMIKVSEMQLPEDRNTNIEITIPDADPLVGHIGGLTGIWQ